MLGNEDNTLMANWLRQWAETEAKGVIVSEREDADGSWLVLTRWPAHPTYSEHERHMWVLQAMAAEDRAAHCH